MNFLDTREAKLSLSMRPACDRVLSAVFDVQPENIHRFEHGEEHILDRHFHIDLSIELQNGSQITGQEKTLSYEFYKFRTFTIEFYQNRYTKEHGEFFKIASQFYLHGYANKEETEFVEWRIIRILDFLDWLRNREIEFLEKRTRPSRGSRASFFYIEYQSIPNQFIFATSVPSKLIYDVAV